MVLPPEARASRLELVKAAFFFLLLALLVMPGVLVGDVYLPGQFLQQYYPWRYALMGDRIGFVDTGNADLVDVATGWQPHDIFFSTWIKRFHLPLWDPTSFCGHPFLANGQSAMFYPPKLLLTLLFSPEDAHNFYLLFHVFFSAWLAYAWMRHYVRLPAAAAVGAVAWSLNGVMMVYLEAKTVLALGVLLPLMFLAIEQVVERPAPRSTAGLAAVIALLLSCGMWQFLVYCLMIGSTYTLYRTWFAAARWRIVLSSCIAVVVGNLIGAVQFWPAVVLSRIAERPWFSFGDHYAQNCFYPENLMTLLIPEFLGGPRHYFYLTRMSSGVQRPLELACHVGMVATLCALAGVVGRWRTHRLVPFFAGWAGFAILCAMGTHLYWPIYDFVPYMRYLTPTRIIYLFPAAVATLAALGVEFLADLSQPVRKRIAGWLAIVPITCLAIVGYTVYCIQHGAGPAPAIIEYCVRHGVLTTYLPNYVGVADFNNRVVGHILQFYQWSNPALVLPPLLGLALLALCWGPWRKMVEVGMVSLTVIDLVMFAWAWNPTVPRGTMYADTPGLQLLKKSVRTVGVLRNAHPDALTPYGIKDAAGYETYYPGRYRHLFDLWQGAESPGYQLIYMAQMGPQFHTLANLLGIDMFYCDPLLPASQFAGFPCIYRREMAIYRNATALPRQFLVTQWQVPGSDAATLQAMASPDFDPSRQVLLESPLPGATTAKVTSGTATVVAENPDTIESVVDTPDAAILVMSDTWDAGWQCTIDGHAVPVMRADYDFRAVPVPVGQHQVTFTYRPLAFVYGKYVSLGGLICLLVLWAYPWQTTSKRQ